MNQTAKRRSGIHDQSPGYWLIHCCVVWITRCLRYRETCCTWRQRQKKEDTSELNKLGCSSSSRLLIMWTGVHPFVTPDSLSLASMSSSHHLVQAASATPSSPFHPPCTYATSCSCHRSPCPIWQSQTEQQLTAHNFASFWFRLMPRAAWVTIIAHRSSVALLERNEAENDCTCCGSCFLFQGCEFSFLVAMEGQKKKRKEQHENTKFDLPVLPPRPRLLFSLFASLPPSFFISPLGPFQQSLLLFGLEKEKKHCFNFIFFFSFSFFRLFFHTSVRCSKPSSADWSESGKLCCQAGLIFTSMCWVKTLRRSDISDYQLHLKWFLGQKSF